MPRRTMNGYRHCDYTDPAILRFSNGQPKAEYVQQQNLADVIRRIIDKEGNKVPLPTIKNRMAEQGYRIPSDWHIRNVKKKLIADLTLTKAQKTSIDCKKTARRLINLVGGNLEDAIAELRQAA